MPSTILAYSVEQGSNQKWGIAITNNGTFVSWAIEPEYNTSNEADNKLSELNDERYEPHNAQAEISTAYIN